MSDAREWLTEVQDQNGGDESPCGVLVRVETAALLAVLDEIDRLFTNAQTRIMEQGYDAYDEGVIDAVGYIERVVDKALGGGR